MERPAPQVSRAGEPYAAGVVRLIDPRRPGGEIHDPAIAVGIPDHPRVAHRPVVPAAGNVLLVDARIEIDYRRAASLPVQEVPAGGATDALLQPVLQAAGSRVEEVPRPAGLPYHRARPRREVVPPRRRSRGERLSEIGPIPQIAGDRVPHSDVPMAHFGIGKRLRRVQEQHLPFQAVANDPEVPDPLVFKRKHPESFQTACGTCAPPALRSSAAAGIGRTDPRSTTSQGTLETGGAPPPSNIESSCSAAMRPISW